MNHKEIAHALGHLRPGAEWTLRGTQLTWLDKTQVQPTQAELETACHNCNPIKEEFAKLKSDTEKLAFLAKQLGL